MQKKGDLTLGVIVSAALVLIVLVVLTLIFTGRLNLFQGAVTDCVKNNGICANYFEGTQTPQEACDDASITQSYTYAADLKCSTGNVCCKKYI